MLKIRMLISAKNVYLRCAKRNYCYCSISEPVKLITDLFGDLVKPIQTKKSGLSLYYIPSVDLPQVIRQ